MTNERATSRSRSRAASSTIPGAGFRHRHFTPVRLDGALGVVRAVIVSVEDDPVAGEERRQVLVRGPDEALVEVAARHARLVGDEHQRKPRVAKPGERGGDAGKTAQSNPADPGSSALRSACRRDPGRRPASCGRHGGAAATEQVCERVGHAVG